MSRRSMILVVLCGASLVRCDTRPSQREADQRMVAPDAGTEGRGSYDRGRDSRVAPDRGRQDAVPASCVSHADCGFPAGACLGPDSSGTLRCGPVRACTPLSPACAAGEGCAVVHQGGQLHWICMPAGKLGEGGDCTGEQTAPRCGAGLVCAAQGKTSLCLRVCDTASSSPCWQDQECLELTLGGEHGVCSPPSSTACDPFKQIGCSPAEKCTVIQPGTLGCVPVGTLGIGELCDLKNDQCKAGLGCATDGSAPARCRVLCKNAAFCAWPLEVCSIKVDSALELGACEPVQPCSVLGQGCPAGMGCYHEAMNAVTVQYCAKAGTIPPGGACSGNREFDHPCGAGYLCVATTTEACRRYCDPTGVENVCAPMSCAAIKDMSGLGVCP